MFGTSFETIQGAIEQGGANTSGVEDFNGLISISNINLFDATYAGTVNQLSDITSSLQYQNYPQLSSPPSQTNTLGTTTTGSLYVTTQTGFSVFLSGQFFSMEPSFYFPPEVWDGSKYTPPAAISLSGTSNSQFLSFTAFGTDTHTDVSCDLTLNDGTTDYEGVLAVDASNNIVVNFNVGTSTGRTINLTGGELNIQF